MDIEQVVHSGLVVMNLAAATRDEAIAELAVLLHADGCITSVEQFLTDVEERETLSSTYCGNFLAIPHGVSPAVQCAKLSIGKSTGIPWGAEDETVKLVFLLAIPPYEADGDSASWQVDVLSRIATVAVDDETRAAWLNAECAEDILSTLRRVDMQERD